MPEEIKDVARFIELSEKAVSCNAKKTKDAVKLKLRMKHRLCTLKIDATKFDEIKTKIKCKITEI
jgi:adenine specific DNA methylase Mod